MTRLLVSLLCSLLCLSGCTASPHTVASSPAPAIPVDRHDLAPGAPLTRSGAPATLMGTPPVVGQALPDNTLIDSHLKPRRLSDFHGSVLLVSVVPSLDTGVCARQTRQLTQLLPQLPADVRVITISRDLPFAQARFAAANDAGDILFLSDYAQGRFGRDSGLMVRELMLLARSLWVIDRAGVIRYRQLVPDLAHLPDLDRAVREAVRLAQER